MQQKKNNPIAKIVECVVLIVITVVFLSSFRLIIVSGDSMYPTLKNHQLVIAKKNFGTPEHNDIIIFDVDGKLTIKKVLACAGDTVYLANGGVYVNDIRIIPYTYEGDDKTIKINDDEFFVIGDNYEMSYDSRDYGAISRCQVKGIVMTYK